MSEVVGVESNEFYGEVCQSKELEKKTKGVIQLQKNELSPIDYRIYCLLTVFTGWIGDIYAGNYLQSLAKVAACIVLGPFFGSSILGAVILGSLFHLSTGQYTDGDGKFVRQIVQLKKEEISSCDHKTTFFLSSVGGVFGAHQFYAGKPLKGVMMLCSFGGLGVWHVVNIIQLTTCGFKDGDGKVICPDYVKLSAENSKILVGAADHSEKVRVHGVYSL